MRKKPLVKPKRAKKQPVESSAEKIVSVLDAKKGEDIKVLDVAKISGLWDYFIICTGMSSVHVRALYNHLDDEMQKAGTEMAHRDIGLDNKWIIADYGDVLVHIFDRETRQYYAIEKMWGEKEACVKKAAKKEKGSAKGEKRKKRRVKA